MPETTSAWVTMMTAPNYLPGVRTLHASLRASDTTRPLVVMVTAQIDAGVRQVLADDGCVVREVASLTPANQHAGTYASARFAQVWTKLAVWELTDWERVVYLDADMLVLRRMDELFDLELEPGAIAACHACRCNPNRITTYPASWVPENCGYSTASGTRDAGVAARPDDYLNAGLLVLRPDHGLYLDMIGKVSALDDLSGYPFAEQDFLNDYFRGRWQVLPYVYNALKTLPRQHSDMWDLAAVKNIHYILDKPWDKPVVVGDPDLALDTLWREIAAGVSQHPRAG